MALMFRLGDFGQSFATRERGEELREALLRALDDRGEVVIDFAGVTTVSYSFADEFLGKLCAEHPVKVRSANISPRVARIAGRATERRAGCALAR